MTTTIGIVGCSKTKLDRAAPARDLYTSPLFVAAAAYCEATYDRWLILSAKYGLVDPDRVLEPYDVTLREMDHVERFHWLLAVREQPIAVELVEQVLRDGAQVFLHAGSLYRWLFGHHGLKLDVYTPLRGLGIGRQLAWYAERRSEPQGVTA